MQKQPVPFSARSILLVEDHASTLQVLSRLLQLMGHHVTPASSVQDALSHLNENHIDLLLSDLALPDGTGHDIMLSCRHRGIPGIAITGQSSPDEIQETLAAGFSCHLVKPFTLDQLESAIASCIPAAPEAPPEYAAVIPPQNPSLSHPQPQPQ